MMRYSLLVMTVIGLTACAGCNSAHKSQATSEDGVDEPKPPTSKSLEKQPKVEKKPDVVPAVVKLPPPDPMRHQPNLPPEQRMTVIFEGKKRVVDRTAAIKVGYTEIPLGDDWTPKIFEPRNDESGQPTLNRYRKTFIALATDQTDGDGRSLPDDERNYLEVFGVPPAMGILRTRFVDDAASECLKSVDYGLIGSIPQLTYRNDRRERRHRWKVRAYRKALKRAMKRAKVTQLEEFEPQKKKLKKKLAYVLKSDHEKRVLAEIEKRLKCDGHMHRKYRHKRGKLDQGLRHAVRRFQRKHKIYEHTNLKKKTMEFMAMPPLNTNYLTLVRVINERVASAAGIVEDGSWEARKGKAAKYRGADGKQHTVKNLVRDFTAVAIKALDLDTPEKALAFFTQRPLSDFDTLRIGVKLPAKPEYYSAQMDLKLVIDRGSVWYDFPYTDEGKPRRQRRKRMPRATLYVRYLDQNIPLVYWPTTIGGWRKELAENGYVYLKYKGSDVGNRVIRKIISGPTWIPPKTTPLRSLAKRRYVKGKTQGVVNYNEMGPGYLSAYGLVAGYFVIPGRNGRRDRDKGIRAHGSSEYMSILSSRRFSHGCHRLMNHHAVRMYGFMLEHRNHVISGDQPMGYSRQFLYNDEVFQIRIPSRGFQYTLDPPVPVTVLEGQIEGEIKEEPEGLFKIPGKKYPALMPGEKPDEDAPLPPAGEPAKAKQP